ncbi:MAG: cupin domain-containing protein [Thermomicrobiales bacterium]
MAVVHGSTLQFVETPGGNFGSGVATPSRGATEVSVIRQRQLPGGANPAHTHDREEVMVVLAGMVTVTVAGEARALGAGDALIVPPRTSHTVANSGAEPAEWLLIAPAGVRFFHTNGEEGSPPWSR